MILETTLSNENQKLILRDSSTTEFVVQKVWIRIREPDAVGFTIKYRNDVPTVLNLQAPGAFQWRSKDVNRWLIKLK